MIQAAVAGKDEINGEFLANMIQSHPLYQATGATR